MMVAHPKDDIETILGWLSYEIKENTPVIHFIFVKEAFRNMGVAREMITRAGIDVTKATFTHWTFPVDEIIRKYPDIIFNPYDL